MSPLLKKVEKAGIQGVKSKRHPHHTKPIDFFKDTQTLRVLFSQLIDNAEPDRIAIIPSASYGLAQVAANLPFTDGEISIVEDQFPSNVFPWMQLQKRGCTLRTIARPTGAGQGARWNEHLLDAITPHTRMVAIGHVDWADGTLFDLPAIRERLDEVGGLLVIDGTQSVGALPFSVADIRPDALVCAAYKWLMGPYSIGLAYYGAAFDQGTPIEESWINRRGSENFGALGNYAEPYREGAGRYSMGEQSNFILAPMLCEALKQVMRWTPEKIQTYCEDLLESTIPELQELNLGVEESAFRANHLFGVRLPTGLSKDKLANSFKKNKVSVSFRGDCVRVSPHVYNDEMDVRKLVKAFKEAIFTN